jgi:hypothetical protein
LLCAISADKVVGWKLYPERTGGVKTNDILAFYDEFIKDKYKNNLIIMDNAVIHKSKYIIIFCSLPSRNQRNRRVF